MQIEKPETLHDRDAEWDALARFGADAQPGATLAVVYGRRRQGKTYLLDALTRRMGGLLHVAVQDVGPHARADLAATLGRYLGTPAPLLFDSWSPLIDALLEVGTRDSQVVVALDEFPYLMAAAPELPSVIQRALSPNSELARRSKTRLVVCGSAMSVMSRLLTGAAPLRGRAVLDLVVHPFDVRETRSFWELIDYESAVMVHAVLGGTPAYRDLLRGAVPSSPEDFDAWVIGKLLNPASPLAREGHYLLAEEPSIIDRALYHAILTAIAEGQTRRGQIAQALGRPDNQLSHPLTLLQDLRLVTQSADVLRARRPTYAIVEPIIRFYHAIIRPQTSRLERGQIAQAWQAATPTFHAQILGPHFEDLARQWVARFAHPETVGGLPDEVGAAVVSDRDDRSIHQVDVVALGSPERGRRPVLLLGEAKWRRAPLGVRDLERLQRVQTLLRSRDDLDVRHTRLGLFSRSGFDPALRERDGVVLVDLARLFEGG